MHAARSTSPAARHPGETANDRWKRRAPIRESHALVIAVAVHFAVLALWPAMSAGIEKSHGGPMEVLPPPRVDVPDPPERIVKPADPVIVAADLDAGVTIPPLQDAWNRRDVLPPPPPAGRPQDPGGWGPITHGMVEPRVLNREEVERALVRHYPPLLRDAGIGGDVRVLLWLDEAGAIVRAEIDQSSGREALDRAALEVVKVMRLSPALNRNAPVRVIVSLPVRFIAR